MSTKFSWLRPGLGGGTAHVRKPFRRVHDRSRSARLRPTSHGLIAWHFRAIPSMASKRSPLKMRAGSALRGVSCYSTLVLTLTGATRSQRAKRIDDHGTHLHRQIVIGPGCLVWPRRSATYARPPCSTDSSRRPLPFGRRLLPRARQANEIGRVRTGRAAEVSPTSALMEPWFGLDFGQCEIGEFSRRFGRVRAWLLHFP